MVNYILLVIFGIFFVLLLSGVRIVRPIERGLIERLGKYHSFAEPGFSWLIPFVDRMVRINITEYMIDVEKQEIITKDKLNAQVDAQVYYKVKNDESSVKNSQYEVNDYEYQIVNLARTTLRNIIGGMDLNDANVGRDKINRQLMDVLTKETKKWGIEVVRTELKEINPPKDVQNTMNQVVIAKNEKLSAIDFAVATETKADGEKKAKIKEAEGISRNIELKAEGEAKAIKMLAIADAERIKVVNESIKKHFTGNAQLYKKLETVERSLSENTKYVIDPNSNITNVISDIAGVTPIKNNKGGK